MSYGYIPGVARYSPFEGAAYAVVESLSKLAAVGADPLKARLTFQEYFERLHDVPTRWGKPAAALLGALEAQLGMGLPPPSAARTACPAPLSSWTCPPPW